MISSYLDYFKNHVGAQFNLDWVRKDSDFVYNQLRHIRRKVPFDSDLNVPVLEIGSGMGRLALLLNEAGFSDYTGLEIDSEALKFSQNLGLESFKFINQEIKYFAKQNSEKRFSIVFCFETLEHLELPIQDLMAIHSLTKEGGLFICTTPYPFKKNIVSDETHLFVLHPINWKRLFEKCGFEDVIVTAMTFLPYMWRINKKWNFIIPFYIPGMKLFSTSLIIARKK